MRRRYKRNTKDPERKLLEMQATKYITKDYSMEVVKRVVKEKVPFFDGDLTKFIAKDGGYLRELEGKCKKCEIDKYTDKKTKVKNTLLLISEGFSWQCANGHRNPSQGWYDWPSGNNMFVIIQQCQHEAPAKTANDFEFGFEPEMEKLIKDAIKKGSHTSVAKICANIHGDRIVHAKGPGIWYGFQRHRWEKMTQDDIKALVAGDDMMWYMRRVEALSESRDKDTQKAVGSLLKNLEMDQFQTSVVSQWRNQAGKTEKEFAGKLDKDKLLLGFENGILDLKEMEFRDGKPEDYVTMTVGYNYEERDESVIQEIKDFIKKIFPDDEVRSYVMKFLGGCLTGYTHNQLFHYGHGEGSNGKGKIIKLMLTALGEYAGTMAASFLTGKTPDANQATPALTSTVGKRFVAISETVEGARINEQLFKALTGQDVMPYRPMFGEMRAFEPEFKLFMVCNDMPEFKGSSGSMDRRIRVIPFESTFLPKSKSPDGSRNEYEIDHGIDDKIRKNWRKQIIHVLMEGCEREREEGLDDVPEKMEVKKQEYIRENDIYKEFELEHIEFGEEKTIKARELINEFKRWLGEMDKEKESKMTETMIGKEFSRRYGVKKVRGNKGQIYRGIGLK